VSLDKGYVLNVAGLKLQGYSVAGITTSIAFPEADACFDVAQGLPFQIPFPNILISHGHMDHASGLPYLIAMKSMTSQPVPQIYMPESLVKPMSDIMKIWAQIDQHEYKFKFNGVENGRDYPLKAPYFFRPFPTLHRVPSHGYTVYERKKHLKAEYRGLPPEDLGRLRRERVMLDEFVNEPILSFTGDSKIEFMDTPDVRNSKVLLMEVTYWDQKKSVANAREWGHIHFDEVLPRLESLKCEKVVFIHASARYTTAYLNEVIDARVPEHLKSRVMLFPRPM
jgi:ribonuclease Z